MLSALGIRSYYTINKPTEVNFPNGTYKCRQSYDLNISTDRHIFLKKIGFLQKYKVHKLIQIIESTKIGNPKNTYPITQIEYIGKYPVYDITVDDTEHTYWTGGLLVSNCGEQTLESYELCNLVETFPARHNSLDEYKRTLKFAYLYAKSVTLIPTHNELTNAIMLRNRRIGLSQSGIVQSINKHGLRKHMEEFCDGGYQYLKELDKIYSDWLCIPRSIKLTSVKPSGSVSLLPGATPGIHFPYSEYYWRTVRLDKGSEIVSALKKAGYRIEDAEGHNTVVVYFPVKEENFSRSKFDVSVWEQLELAAQMQHYWADNQVSVTVSFREEEKKDLKVALSLYETRLKSLSLFPLMFDISKFKHPPYKPITKEEYDAAISKLGSTNFSGITETMGDEKVFCDSDSCLI
jgi:hypothetical protein